MIGSRNPKDLLALTITSLLLGVLTAVHVHVGLQGPDYAGPFLILDHLFDLGLVLALLAICAALGRFALCRCGIFFEQPLEALLFAIVVGSGIMATTILTLGLLSGLQKLTLGLLLLSQAIVARKELGQIPVLSTRALSQLKSHSDELGLWIFAALIFSSVALFLIVLAMAPPADWDALMYHLQVPNLFLQEGRIYLPEDNLHAAVVGLVHMLYLPLLALGSSSGPALVNAFLALLLGLAVFSFCTRFLSGATASLSLLLLWGTTTVLLVAITPRVDVTLALFLFLAHYALFIALSGSPSRRHFYLAGVLLGFAVGIKYHGIAYILGLSPLLLWLVGSPARRLGPPLRPLFLFGLVLFGAAAPWLAKNWILLGAPLYPFFAERLVEPWVATLYPSRAVPATIDPVFAALGQVRMPFNVPDLFLAPGRLTVELEGAYYYANPILLLLPLWVFFLRDKSLNWLVIPALGYLLILILPFPATNLRYLIPAVPPLTIVAVDMTVRCSRRLLSDGAARLFLVLLAALAMVPSGKAMYVWMARTQALGHLAGIVSREEYLRTHPDIAVRLYAPLISVVNRDVPKEGRVLMLLESRGYYFNSSVIQDNELTNWPLLAPQASTVGCLRDFGISHVLVNMGSLRYYIFRGLNVEVLRWDLFQQFARNCLAPAYRQPGFILYRVR